MKILSIDTASDLSTVAILENTNCIKEIIVDDARNHSEKIMPIIEQVLKETNMQLKDIDLIVCDKGPGSFTGIRIGVGTVLGFRDSLKINCVGVSSLEALAYNVKHDGIICSLIDAKNNNVYFGLFNIHNGVCTQIGELEFKSITEIFNILDKFDNQITFVGDGAISYKSLIENSYRKANFTNENNLSSISLGIAGYNIFNSKKENSIMPLYLRKSQAERAIDEKA